MNSLLKNSRNFKFDINDDSIFTWLLKLLFFFIYYQQILVVNIGGSFKIYELIALTFLIFFFVGNKKIYGWHSFLLFLFFVVSTSISFLIYYVELDAKDYYFRFPEANEQLRFNIYVVPIIILIYYFFNWVTINFIIGSKWVHTNSKKLVKIYVYSGTLVSIYSLYGVFFVNVLGFPDLIPSFFDFRNSSPTFQIRPAGFSAEPSSYIVMLSWIMLFLLFLKNLFSKWIRNFLLFVNGFVLILTMSSAIVAFVGSIIVYYLFFQGFDKFLKILVLIVIFCSLLYFGVEYYLDIEFVKYTFYQKIVELFSPPDTILSSGQFRSYTSWLGIEIFKDYPLFGVGGGNSYFFLYKYEHLFSIDTYGFELTYSVPPMNIYTKVLAELGSFGFSLFLIFSFYVLYTFSRVHKQNDYFKIGFIGMLMTLGFCFSIYPEYSLFLWINIALCLNSYHLRDYLK